MDDEDIQDGLERIRKGDSTGLNSILARYKKPLLRIIHASMNRHQLGHSEQEDILQDASITAFKKCTAAELAGMNTGRAFFKWMVVVIRWKLKDLHKFLRAAKRDARRTESIEGHLAPGGHGSDCGDGSEPFASDGSPENGLPIGFKKNGKGKGQSGVARPVAPFPSPPDTPSGILEKSSRISEVRQVLEMLPELQRKAIQMVILDRIPAQKAAGQLQCSTGELNRVLVDAHLSFQKLILMEGKRFPYISELKPRLELP